MDVTLWQLPNNEEAAIEFLKSTGIIHKERVCSNNHQMKLYITEPPIWRCCLRSCKERKGMRTKTWFEGRRIPFLTAVRFIYCWCQELTSVEFCELQLQMNHNTSVEWNCLMRETCLNALLSRPKVKIGGSNKIIEIDEGIFKKKKSTIGPQRVFGGICKETKECFLVAIPERSPTALMAAIEQNIEDETTIYTDCWQAYETSELQNAGYDLFTENHKYSFVDPDTGNNNQIADRLWGCTAWRNKRYHKESYFIEFMWRCLYPKTEMFSEMLKSIRGFMPPL
ncbi:hypothetical protein AVEN_74054-1 [Araneus ventricosus]|uniref:ISXO2-like transposase domain-containing protein n=1 Tax=Araneus ventricosus TaxID=182803 RepID=A0A4Y2XDY7_ARAVE|nr:hypothetical protein AVEN_5600-1 [Araneus ventricosus]GBO46689.1 hypothetical protein AVEN_74054-1 [Araneus ventricosus]